MEICYLEQVEQISAAENHSRAQQKILYSGSPEHLSDSLLDNQSLLLCNLDNRSHLSMLKAMPPIIGWGCYCSLIQQSEYTNPEKSWLPRSGTSDFLRCFEKHKEAADWCKDDLDNDSLEGQLQSLQKSQTLRRGFGEARVEERGGTFVDLYDAIKDGILYCSQLKELIEIALSQPLTSCSAERAFSELKLIKTRLTSTMEQKRLQSLMLMSVESDILANLDTKLLVKKFVDAALGNGLGLSLLPRVYLLVLNT